MSTTTRARAIYWPSLSDTTGRNGIDGHIRALNALNPDGYGLDEVYRYLNSQTQLKPQSVEVLAYGIYASIRKTMGMDLMFDPDLKSILQTFFHSYRIPRRGRPVPKDVPIPDLIQFTSKCGVVARYWSEFLFLSSLRVSEACAIRLNDCRVVESGCTIRVRQKGGSMKEVLVPSDLFYEIRHIFRGQVHLFETRSGGQYRRQDVATILREQSVKILGYRITPHMLRHTFGTYIATRRPDIIRAGITQMGHRGPETFFQYYVHQKLSVGDIPRLTQGYVHAAGI